MIWIMSRMMSISGNCRIEAPGGGFLLYTNPTRYACGSKKL
jgi:hypothetical protein